VKSPEEEKEEVVEAGMFVLKEKHDALLELMKERFNI